MLSRAHAPERAAPQTLLTCMIEMLTYVDSDKSEFSEEVFEGFMRRGGLAGEIVEEERGEEPPEDGSEKHIPGPRRRAAACQTNSLV